jgi:hypothetical protein
MFALIVGVCRDESFGSIVFAVMIVGMAIKLPYFIGILFHWNTLGEAHQVAAFLSGIAPAALALQRRRSMTSLLSIPGLLSQILG